MRRFRRSAFVLGLLLSISSSSPVRADDPVRVRELVIDVSGRQADGLVAYPQGPHTTLVVVAHGRGHTTESWRAHLAEIASHGAIAVAMNYSTTFEGVAEGAAETVAAARFFQARFPIRATYLVGVSMGGIPAGMALAESRGVFDWWVDVEPVSNLAETWSEAKFAQVTGLEREAAAEIERETGGTPATHPQEYVRRSAALRAREIAASGVGGAVVIHAVSDGLVPYDQGRELVSALAANGLPTDFYTVIGRDCRTNAQGNTTLQGYAGANPDCLAGHARETLRDHVVMRLAFEALYGLMDGTYAPRGYQEFVVDQPAP